MAELAVATALGLVQIMTPLLTKLNLPTDPSGLLEDVERMRSWHSSMQAFLAENNGREGRETLLDLVEKVRRIAYAIEDVLDDFTLHSPPYLFHSHRISRKIHSYGHHLYHLFPLLGVSGKIKSIKKHIKDIMQQSDFSRHVYSNPSGAPSSSSTNTVTSPLLLDHEMVGYENHKAQLMRRLVDGDQRLVTVAVDGPPGSGKTTLVNNVFCKPQIQAQFDCHAWICVSHNPHIDNISQNLLRQLCTSREDPYPPDDGSPLQTRLLRYLSRKRYLVVLDDIWKDEDWTHLKNALPDSKCGSRIIFTTRYSNLSSISASHDHVCSLPGLEPLDAGNLFCKRAFPDGERPSELEDISLEIMARCEGLPLAIVAVAGALSQKPPTLYEWKRFQCKLGSGIGMSPSLSPINNALLRSYMDLSSTLKCCFLYMSIFPKNHSVERGRLIRLWVAERFALPTEDQTAEEVAEDYLNQLIRRNLLHVSCWDFDGRPRNCRVLNPVLMFIIQKCKDENFASIFPMENTSSNQRMMIRRLAVHNQCQRFPKNGDFASVRSMFLFRVLDPSNFEENLRKLKLIKVLDMQGAPLTKFPKEMSRFTLMRYLSFRETKIKSIPESIEKLSYLETLDLKQTDVRVLPQQISNLHNLCHLFVYKYNNINYISFESTEGVKLHEGICRLANLQNLSLVEVGPNGRILKDLKALTQLRKLGVTGLRREHGKHLCAAVEMMKSLKTLDITSSSKEEYIDLEEMQQPPRTLQRLYLKGRLSKIPAWIGELHNLLRICLKWSKLSDTPLKTLKHLPNLTELQLVDCFTGEEGLTFETSGFKKLEILLVEDLSNASMIVIENGTMPELKKISLRRCPGVRIVLGVENLIKVEEMTLYDMPKELVDRLSINGEDREYVQHIPLIHSFTLTIQRWSLQNLSHPVSFSH